MIAAWRARARCMRSSQAAYASAPPVGLPAGAGACACATGASSRPLSLELIAKAPEVLGGSVRPRPRGPQELVHRHLGLWLRWDTALGVRAAKCAARIRVM